MDCALWTDGRGMWTVGCGTLNGDCGLWWTVGGGLFEVTEMPPSKTPKSALPSSKPYTHRVEKAQEWACGDRKPGSRGNGVLLLHGERIYIEENPGPGPLSLSMSISSFRRNI